MKDRLVVWYLPGLHELGLVPFMKELLALGDNTHARVVHVHIILG